MKRLFGFLFTIFLAAMPCILFVTCSKESAVANNDYGLVNNNTASANATIVSRSTLDCPCCEGYFISIDNQKPIAGNYFLTNEFPGGYKPATYPVKVYIEWQKNPNVCINDNIIIKKVVVIK